jgi:hypothetical protein
LFDVSGGVMAGNERPALQGAEAKQGCIYSVVFTGSGKTTEFEIYQLKGSPKDCESMALDLQKAKDWLEKQGRG